jgi:hypothetical protein
VTDDLLNIVQNPLDSPTVGKKAKKQEKQVKRRGIMKKQTNEPKKKKSVRFKSAEPVNDIESKRRGTYNPYQQLTIFLANGQLYS